MNGLESVPITKQQHPDLAADNPFDLAWEYFTGVQEDFTGDMHKALQMVICLTGSAEVLFDGFSAEYAQGGIFFHMCWEPHAVRSRKPHTFLLAVNLDLDSLGAIDPFGNCNWLLPFILPPGRRFRAETEAEKRQICQFGKKLYNLWKERPFCWRQESWLAINALLLQVIRKLEGDPALQQQELPIRESNLTRIRPALELAVGGKNLSLTEAAHACSLSPSRFSEIFRHTMGTSYGQFAARGRLEEATRMLTHSNLSLSEIAERFGFFDASHFCHVFSRIYHCSPGVFRQRKQSPMRKTAVNKDVNN